jgi:Plant Basic Secretory Protein.
MAKTTEDQTTAAEYLDLAHKILKQINPKVASVLGLKTLDPDLIPIHIVAGNPKNMGYAMFGGIALNAPDIRKFGSRATPGRTLDGLIAHELTHVYLGEMGTPYDEKNSYLHEGLADYVSYTITPGHKEMIRGKVGDVNGAEFGTQGYFGTANLLAHEEDQNPGTVKAVVQYLTAGDEDPFLAAVGATAADEGSRVFGTSHELIREGGGGKKPRVMDRFANETLPNVPVPGGGGAGAGLKGIINMPGTGGGTLSGQPTIKQEMPGTSRVPGGNPIRKEGFTSKNTVTRGSHEIVNTEYQPPALAKNIRMEETTAAMQTFASHDTGPTIQGGTYGGNKGGPPPPPPAEKPPDTKNTTTGGGGSSSSSSSSSGPPIDLYISDTFKQDAVKRTKEQMFAQVYEQLWGEPATEAYLMKAVNEGLNSFEFAARERQKPEFADTKTYQDQARGLRDVFSQLGVA